MFAFVALLAGGEQLREPIINRNLARDNNRYLPRCATMDRGRHAETAHAAVESLRQGCGAAGPLVSGAQNLERSRRHLRSGELWYVLAGIAKNPNYINITQRTDTFAYTYRHTTR